MFEYNLKLAHRTLAIQKQLRALGQTWPRGASLSELRQIRRIYYWQQYNLLKWTVQNRLQAERTLR